MKKIKISKEKLDRIIKEEAIRLKSEFLIKEEAQNKLALLESQLGNIEQEMHDVYAEDELDEEAAEMLGMTQEVLGFSKFEKAKKAYKELKAQELGQLMVAYKAYSPEYIKIAKQLMGTLRQDAAQLAQQFGITDVQVFYKDLLQVAQPMDFNTFKRQAQKGGASFRDIASGAQAGQAGDFGM
jgi:superfamily I DNA and/or RNA helicase